MKRNILFVVSRCLIHVQLPIKRGKPAFNLVPYPKVAVCHFPQFVRHYFPLTILHDDWNLMVYIGHGCSLLAIQSMSRINHQRVEYFFTSIKTLTDHSRTFPMGNKLDRFGM